MSAKGNAGKWLIFCLGTNNWQGGNEFAPGSGILHESHHHSFQQLDNVDGVYSIWPSKNQKTNPERKDYRVFELTHDIPICESVSPVSSYRWHSMSEEEFQAYHQRLLGEVEAYIDAVETEQKQFFNLFIAHHTFVNPVVMCEVNKRRVAAGKPHVPCLTFAHGTALKMYQNELKGEAEFPSRFLPYVKEKNIFGNTDQVQGVFVVSTAQKDTFLSVWDQYPADQVVVAPCGYNQRIFRPIEGATAANTLPDLKVSYYDGIQDDVPADSPSSQTILDASVNGVPHKNFDKYVLFTGRFADWKRLDVVLRASQTYQKVMKAEHNISVATLVVGGGADKDELFYRQLAFKELGLGEHVFFLGRQPQDVLAKLNTVVDICAFPSHDEPFGLVFIEALGCGCPVIGAKSGGPIDIVNDSVGTLLEETPDNLELSKSLSDTVITSLVDDWKKTKGPQCLSHVMEKYSLVAQCAEMLRVVDKQFVPAVPKELTTSAKL